MNFICVATDEGEATTAAPSKTVEQGEVGGTLMDNVLFPQTFHQSNNISYVFEFHFCIFRNVGR